MIPLAPALLVAAANAFVGLGEDGGDNRGQMVELFLKEVHQDPGQPWCAAFVYHVGHWSHYDHVAQRSTWPLKATASCAELAKNALDDGILKLEPHLGDVFLKFSKKLDRFAHTGIVVGLHDPDPHEDMGVYVCTTIEGNTNADGSANGHTTLRKVRRFSTNNGDAFIRWVDLEWRKQAA